MCASIGISAGGRRGYPLRRCARLVGAPNYPPSLCSVAGLLLALALKAPARTPSPPCNVPLPANVEPLASITREARHRCRTPLKVRTTLGWAPRAHARGQLVASERML